MINRYPGQCVQCHEYVPSGLGTVTKRGRVWRIDCNACTGTHAERLRPCVRPHFLRLERHQECARPLRGCAVLRLLYFLNPKPNASKLWQS
jgi:hypothetical protein